MQKTIAVKLSSKSENLVKKGHPWVYSDSILKENKKPNTGDIAIIFNHNTNAFLAIGLYDCDSPIRIKIIQAHNKAQLNKEFFNHLITLAYKKRKPLLEQGTTGYRLINGENDQIPTLIVDIYNDVAVIKVYSFIYKYQFQLIKDALIEQFNLRAIVFRCARKVENDSKSTYGYQNGEVIYGELQNEEVHFKEYGVEFKANVVNGHKTGYFLDHRENRHKIAEIAQGKTVLDIFSYAGGFAVHALSGGAKQVTCVDVSAQALAIAQQNAQLNQLENNLEIIKGDAFQVLEALKRDQKQYDIVVVDPPSFAKKQSEIEKALHSYSRLANLAPKLVVSGGLLVMASCSSRVSQEEFFTTIEQTMRKKQVKFSLLEKTFHAIDHPANYKEAEYLKCGYYRIW